MTYEEFKKELYRNILQQEETKDKQVRLFERKSICVDTQDIHIIKALNVSCYGFADVVVHEDILCVLWGLQERLSMMHWKVRPLFEQYKQEGWQSVLPEIISRLQQVGKSNQFLFMENGSYEECSDRLILRPLNYLRHRQSLNNCIYWRYGDIALVLYGLVSDVDSEYITMKIKQEFTKRWDISNEQLLANTLWNCYAKMPPRLFRAEDMINNPEQEQGVFMSGEKGIAVRINRKNKREGMRGYRLTTTRQMNGALAIFYPGVKERIAEILGGDFFVGFTSVHEAVIHPVIHKNLNDMKAAIQHVNAVFDEQDMLTNRVYRYSCKRKQLLEV